MIADLNIISVNQKEPLPLQKINGFILANDADPDSYYQGRYPEHWTFYSNIQGITYTLLKDDVNNPFLYLYDLAGLPFESIINTDFYRDAKTQDLPYWIKDEGFKGDLRPVLCDDNVFAALKETIQLLMNASPLKMVVFHTRYQSYDNEVICGVLSYVCILPEFIPINQFNPTRQCFLFVVSFSLFMGIYVPCMIYIAIMHIYPLKVCFWWYFPKCNKLFIKGWYTFNGNALSKRKD